MKNSIFYLFVLFFVYSILGCQPADIVESNLPTDAWRSRIGSVNVLVGMKYGNSNKIDTSNTSGSQINILSENVVEGRIYCTNFISDVLVKTSGEITFFNVRTSNVINCAAPDKPFLFSNPLVQKIVFKQSEMILMDVSETYSLHFVGTSKLL